MQINKARGEWIIDVVVWMILVLFCFICLYPFWFIIVASLNEGNDMMRGGVYWWPRKFTFDNYTTFFAQSSWLSAVKVSVARTLVGTAFTVFITSLVSYALSRRNLVHGKVYRIMFVFSMYVSGGLIPFYIVLRLAGLINTFWVYILPTTLNLYFVLVGINFFRSIPESLIEAAYLDGAAERRIFLQIVLPLSTPFIATLALFAAVGQWNSWLDSVYYVSIKSLRPMAYWMISMMNRTQGSGANQDLSGAINLTALATQSTAVVATVAPILLVYPFLQKYFVQGMMIGSIKE